MVMRYLLLLCLVASNLIACEKDLPSYGDVVVVDEKDTKWKVTLHKSRHNVEGAIVMQLEYVNEKGDSFSVKPENVAISDDKGNLWLATGNFPYIALLRPGNSKTVNVLFKDIPVTKQKLYLHPFYNLSTRDPKLILKGEGKDPVPGHHVTADWSQAE